jgi:hypothetical protein
MAELQQQGLAELALAQVEQIAQELSCKQLTLHLSDQVVAEEHTICKLVEMVTLA